MKAPLLKAVILSLVFLRFATIAAHSQTNYTPYSFTTLAGSGATGFNDGTGTNASFYNPDAIAADGAGNVFVGESYGL